MNKNNTIKVKSITDVITNSSTEVFTFYNDGGIKTIKDTIEALGIKNVAFGAHFIKSLEKSHKIKTWIYPAETYSKNVLLKENEVVITSSSFNLTPVKVIKL